MLPERGRRAGAERPRDDRTKRGGIAQRSEGGGAGRPCGTEVRGMARGGAAARSNAPPPERSGAGIERGHYTPRRAASKASGGEGGRGGGDRGQGLRAGAMATTTRLRAQRAIKRQRRGNFRARTGRDDSMEERPDKASGGERGDPKRATTTSLPPLCLRVERTRGDTQRTLIRKGGAERSPQRVC